MGNYNADLADGLRFQETVRAALDGVGLRVRWREGFEAQLAHGESYNGLEVKHDRQFAKTANLYLEYEATTRRGAVVRTGVLANDSSRFFAIGDETNFFIFSKKDLRRVFDRLWSRPTEHLGDIPTRGKLLPQRLIAPIAIEVWANLPMLGWQRFPRCGALKQCPECEQLYLETCQC